MWADYDSEADALSIELRRVKRFDYGDQVDDDYCNVGIVGGRVVAIELLNPADHLGLLSLAASRYELDAPALVAAAKAALAAPDRLVSLKVAERVAA
ncbi:MAG: hypothetical protein ACJ75S_00495 [Solirubrobacterales bacterium]